jgi:hypothetical protein
MESFKLTNTLAVVQGALCSVPSAFPAYDLPFPAMKTECP